MIKLHLKHENSNQRAWERKERRWEKILDKAKWCALGSCLVKSHEWHGDYFPGMCVRHLGCLQIGCMDTPFFSFLWFPPQEERQLACLLSSCSLVFSSGTTHPVRLYFLALPCVITQFLHGAHWTSQLAAAAFHPTVKAGGGERPCGRGTSRGSSPAVGITRSACLTQVPVCWPLAQSSIQLASLTWSLCCSVTLD